MRKTIDITISRAGRDFGNTYRLTEMPAAQAEKWAMRAFLAMAKGGVEVPDDIASSGLAGIATLGLKTVGMIPWADAEPLMDEMFQGVQVVPDASRPAMVTPLFPDSIQEISTRLLLRKELFKLHVDFSGLAGALTSASSASQPAA